MRFTILPALAALVASACTPVLAGNRDLLLRDLLVRPGATAEAIAPLLGPEVVVHRASGTVRGVAAAAAALAEVKVVGEPRFFRHHDVSLIAFGDGRTLLMQRDAQDKVVRTVELRAPSPGDTVPKRTTYYGLAWNSDVNNSRLALCEMGYAATGRYVDPGHDVSGPAEVSQMIANFRFVVPRSIVKYVGGLTEAQEGWVTADWVVTSRLGGRLLFTGFDVMHLDVDGKIDFLAGFIGTRRNGPL